MDLLLGTPTFLNWSLRIGSLLLIDHIRDQRNLKRYEEQLRQRALEDMERTQWSQIEKAAHEESEMVMNSWIEAIDLNKFRLLLKEGEDFITSVCGENYQTAHTGWSWESNPSK